MHFAPEFSLDIFAVGGRRIEQMADVFPTVYQPNMYDAIVVAGGVNDVISNRSFDDISASIVEILLQTNGEQIILTTIAPFRGRADIWTLERQQVADQVDQWVLNLAENYPQISVFDIRSILDSDGDQIIDSAMTSVDGLHPGICSIDQQCGMSLIANAFISEFVAVPELMLGDVNRDGLVDFYDISPFISVLSIGEFQDEANIDQNGPVNFFDIAPFISLLSGQ